MDPVTHAVIGMTVSKITGNGLDFSNPVYAGIIAGSVFPDIDILLQKWGDYVYLKNHRGVTHSIIGLFVSAALIAVVIGGIYHVADIQNIFLWSLIGCLSHSFIDIFNPYGTKLLWPFSDKKFSISLVILFDPVCVGTLTGYIFTHGALQWFFLAAFVLYLVSRAAMRLFIKMELKRKYDMDHGSISLLPSMKGILKWHFVLKTKDADVIGEKDILKRRIKITHILNKTNDKLVKHVLESKPGKFFAEFTPLIHVACEETGKTKKYVLTDMRYCVKNNFLHHAFLEIDENDEIISASFNPYSVKRSTSIPM
ncbi:MAG TPA: metal-dependent hydrolase [Clostridia bacterium]|nr:metal-dependent hydrolase [Clostridia bacterium]